MPRESPRATCGVTLCRKSCLVLHSGMPILFRPSGLRYNPGGWVCLLLSFLALNFMLLMGSKPYHLDIAFTLYLYGPWTQSRPCLRIFMASCLQRACRREPQTKHSFCPRINFLQTEISMMVSWPNNQMRFSTTQLSYFGAVTK